MESGLPMTVPLAAGKESVTALRRELAPRKAGQISCRALHASCQTQVLLLREKYDNAGFHDMRQAQCTRNSPSGKLLSSETPKLSDRKGGIQENCPAQCAKGTSALSCRASLLVSVSDVSLPGVRASLQKQLNHMLYKAIRLNC